MALGPALTREKAEAALQVGLDVGQAQGEQGVVLLTTGDGSIANTTASAAIAAARTGASVAEVIGRGTGVDDAGRARKVAVLERARAFNCPNPHDPVDVGAKVGGLEIAGLSGAMVGAAARRIPIVADGFISGAAASAAVRLAPEVQPCLIASRRSVEAGHRWIFDELDRRPLLDLGLRLGEGSDVVLAFHLVEAVARILNDMATFAEVEVSDKT